MKKLPYMLSAITLMFTSHGLLAADAGSEARGFYAGIGSGRLDFDLADATFRNSAGVPVRGSALDIDIDEKLPLRVSLGYNWGGWALEAGYERMLSSADMTIGNARLDFDYSNWTVGGAYRSFGTVYVLAKAGLSMPDLASNTAGTRLKMGNSGYIGAGVGYRFAPTWSAEFDYTHTNDDTGAFMLNLRKHF